MCLKGPTVPLPSLPSPLSLGAGIGTPPVGLDAHLCCKFAHYTLPPTGVPLFVATPIPAAIVSALTGAVSSIIGYVSQLPAKCPLE